jgi:hypothetical protein
VWSTTGLRKFIRWIDYNRDDEVIGAELLGLLATMVMAHTRIGRAYLAFADEVAARVSTMTKRGAHRA